LSELHKIIGHLDELNNQNGSNVSADLYGKRRNTLKGEIHQYNTHNGTDLRLVQPVQGVRKFKIRGLGI